MRESWRGGEEVWERWGRNEEEPSSDSANFLFGLLIQETLTSLKNMFKIDYKSKFLNYLITWIIFIQNTGDIVLHPSADTRIDV